MRKYIRIHIRPEGKHNSFNLFSGKIRIPPFYKEHPNYKSASDVHIHLITVSIDLTHCCFSKGETSTTSPLFLCCEGQGDTRMRDVGVKN